MRVSLDQDPVVGTASICEVGCHCEFGEIDILVYLVRYRGHASIAAVALSPLYLSTNQRGCRVVG